MKYRFYVIEDLPRPMVEIEPDFEYLGHLLSMDIGPRKGRCQGILKAIAMLRNGELETFGWGGNAAHAEFDQQGATIRHETLEDPESIFVSLDDFESIIRDWMTYVAGLVGDTSTEEVHNPLTAKMIELHQKRSGGSSD
jgi:hypothetical protein